MLLVSLTDYFSLPQTYPLTTPYIVTFHLVSGDLRGGNDKKYTVKKRNVVLTLLFALSKKAFLWLWPGQALAIGTGYDIFRKRRQGWSEVLAPLQEPG